MKPMLQRVLMGYRPLYLNGLLLDGQYKLPRPNLPDAIGTSRARQRTVLAALTPVVFHYRSKR
jgi:hypothetical protein